MDTKLFATVFATVFLAELGDKTQLATFLYAADAPQARLTVFVAAAGALVLTSALGVLFGGAIAQFVSARTLSRAAGLAFVALGVWVFARA